MTDRENDRVSRPSDRLELDHDWQESDSLAVTIMEGLERVSGRSGDSFAPLHETVDVDALEALFAPRTGGTPRGPGDVSFELADFEVTVTSEGTVFVGPL
jgi:hypothetical protein